MKLFVNKIVSEFNKILSGTKRVGDSLKLEGKREFELDVLNSSKLGYKTESTLNVNHSVYSDNAEKLRSVGLDGEPDVNGNGDPVFKTENQLSVDNTQYVRGVEPLNMEVDIARRLKVGSAVDSPIINVESLVTHPSLYRVKDSGLLGGKLETNLEVKRARDADNADLLNDTAQEDLVVEKARIATKLTTQDGQELQEHQLRVYRTETIRYGDEVLDLNGLRIYILTHPKAKEIIPDLATAAQHITKSGESIGYTFDDIMSHLKTDSASEIYKATRLITDDSNAPAKTGAELKTWIIDHSEFSNKVATLNAKSADRATKFGDQNTNYTVAQYDDHIKTSVVVNTAATANNALKLNNKTDTQLKTEFRTDYFTNAGSTLVDAHVDGFFGANKVKLAVQGIKVNAAINSDTVGEKTVQNIKDEIAATGIANAAKFLVSSTGSQISHANILTSIDNAKNDIIGGASTDYNTLGELETFIKTNASAISTETTNRQTADNTLQSNIDIEKVRINAILDGSTNDFNSFGEVKSYVDTKTGDLSTLSTTTNTNLVAAINSLEVEINNLEAASSSSTANVSGTLDNTITAVGVLKSNGQFDKNAVSNTDNYTNGNSAGSVYGLIQQLDDALFTEENSRISAVAGVQSNIDDTNTALTTEVNRAKGVEGTLGSLTTFDKSNLVAAINEVAADLSTEETNRTSDTTSLTNSITTLTMNLNNEVTARTTADTTLQTNLNNEISNRTTADNTLQGNIDTVSGNLATEISDRTAADTALSGNIVNVGNNLAAEITLRENADTLLQTELDATQTGAGLETNGSYTAFDGANYISEAVSLRLADQALDSALKVEETARIDADTALSDRFAAFKTVLGGDDFNETSQQISFAGTNYLGSFVSYFGAVKELDSMLKSTNTTVTNGLAGKVATTSQLYLDEILTGDTTAVVGTRYYVDVSGGVITLTLPSDASNFDRILIHGLDGDFEVNNLTITKDLGHTIMKKDESLIVNTNEETFELVFINNDWRVL
jgi:hypothetical protein